MNLVTDIFIYFIYLYIYVGVEGVTTRRWRHSKEIQNCHAQTLIGEIRGEDVRYLRLGILQLCFAKKNHCVKPRAFAELCERGTILNEFKSNGFEC